MFLTIASGSGYREVCANKIPGYPGWWNFDSYPVSRTTKNFRENSYPVPENE